MKGNIDYSNEIWKPVVGYEGFYEVSNYGRIKSLNYRNTGKDRLIKLVENNKGYYFCGLNKDGNRKFVLVHRLVAIAFIPNPDDKSEIDHIDINPHNNRVENLRWCNHQENMNNLSSISKMTKSHKGKPNIKNRKPVVQYDLNGTFINEYDSGLTASKELGVNNSCISMNLKGRIKSTGGFVFRYK